MVLLDDAVAPDAVAADSVPEVKSDVRDLVLQQNCFEGICSTAAALARLSRNKPTARDLANRGAVPVLMELLEDTCEQSDGNKFAIEHATDLLNGLGNITFLLGSTSNLETSNIRQLLALCWSNSDDIAHGATCVIANILMATEDAEESNAEEAENPGLNDDDEVVIRKVSQVKQSDSCTRTVEQILSEGGAATLVELCRDSSDQIKNAAQTGLCNLARDARSHQDINDANVLTHLARNLKKQCTRRSAIAALTNLVCLGEFITAEQHCSLNQIQDALRDTRYCGTDDSISETLVGELSEQIKMVLQRAQKAADEQFNKLMEEECDETSKAQQKKEKGKAKRKKAKAKAKKDRSKGVQDQNVDTNGSNVSRSNANGSVADGDSAAPCSAVKAAKHPAVAALSHSTPHQKPRSSQLNRMMFHCTPELGQLMQRRSAKGGLDSPHMESDFPSEYADCFETPSHPDRQPLDLMAMHGRWSV
jgi:hypothetical protein